MKRTALKRKTPLLRTKSLKASPSKRLEPERPLALWCELGLPGCQGRAVHRHERKRRAQGGDGSVANTLSLCDSCHREVHRSPFIAYANGWQVESWKDPAKVPVVRRSGIAEQLGFDGL